MHELCTVCVQARVDPLGTGAQCAHTLSTYCIHCMHAVITPLAKHIVNVHGSQSPENQDWL